MSPPGSWKGAGGASVPDTQQETRSATHARLPINQRLPFHSQSRTLSTGARWEANNWGWGKWRPGQGQTTALAAASLFLPRRAVKGKLLVWFCFPRLKGKGYANYETTRGIHYTFASREVVVVQEKHPVIRRSAEEKGNSKSKCCSLDFSTNSTNLRRIQ